MDRVEVDFSEIDDLARDIADDSGGITGSLDTLDTAIVRLGDDWSGEARDAFGVMYDDWSTRFDGLNGALASIAASVERIADIYRQAEDDVLAMSS